MITCRYENNDPDVVDCRISGGCYRCKDKKQIGDLVVSTDVNSIPVSDLNGLTNQYPCLGYWKEQGWVVFRRTYTDYDQKYQYRWRGLDMGTGIQFGYLIAHPEFWCRLPDV